MSRRGELTPDRCAPHRGGRNRGLLARRLLSGGLSTLASAPTARSSVTFSLFDRLSILDPSGPTVGVVFRCFDYAATFAWALSGAVLGARRGYDVTGTFALALVSACGGGLLRDAVFLQSGPPALVRTPVYLLLAATASLVIWLAGVRALAPWRVVVIRATEFADALGLGAFAVVGTRLALTASIGFVGATLVGVVNAVGGGLLRNVLVREAPEVLKPGTLTALAAFCGSLLYLVLSQGLALGEKTAGMTTIACVAALRFCSVHFELKTRPAWGPKSRRWWRDQIAGLPRTGFEAPEDLHRASLIRPPSEQGAQQTLVESLRFHRHRALAESALTDMRHCKIISPATSFPSPHASQSPRTKSAE